MAESFGGDPERYDRTRPPYPDALVRRIVTTALAGRSGTRADPRRGTTGPPHPPDGPHSPDAPSAPPVPAAPDVLDVLDVLDVGCGTGIAARQFQAAGCRVLGVEPDPRMAALARRLGTETEVASFESWEPAGRRYDAVVAGTAWHWVDPVAGAAAAARVLRPGGLLALFWHVFQFPPDLAEAIADVCQRVLPDTPVAMSRALTRPALDLYRPVFDRTADGIRAAVTGARTVTGAGAGAGADSNSDPDPDARPGPGARTRIRTEAGPGPRTGTRTAPSAAPGPDRAPGARARAFTDPDQWRFDWEVSYTRDAWLDQIPTQGVFTRLAPGPLARLLAGVGTAIDAYGGSFTMRYSTMAVAATRLP